MFSHKTKIRVRYGETDQMGIMYYGNYALYYEVGRVEAIRSLGVTYKSLEEDGIGMPVVRLESKFLKPAYYDEVVTITTSIEELPHRLITFHVTMHNENDHLIHKARVVLCFQNFENGAMVKAPAKIIEKLKPYFDDA